MLRSVTTRRRIKGRWRRPPGSRSCTAPRSRVTGDAGSLPATVRKSWRVPAT